MNNMEFEEAKFKAIKYVGISKKTSFEVTSKLRRIGVSEKVIANVLEYLKEFNYINDLDYVDSFIRQNVRFQKYSIYEIKEKLKIKGIKQDVIEDRIDKLIPDDYEENIINKLTNLKSRTLDETKIKQYLYRRGFKNM